MRIRSAQGKYRISTKFGQVPGYPLNNGFHKGVDYVSDDPYIYAPQESIVTGKGYDKVNGNYLVLEHNGFRDWFSHIDTYEPLKIGQAVPLGKKLAKWGDTGAADGAHIHHGLRVNGELVDPEKYITEGEDMATPAQIDEQISLMHQLAFGKPPSDAVFKDRRNLFNSIGFVKASIQTEKEYDRHPDALKNKKTIYVPYNGKQLFTKG